ncbi:MAG: hypothetical protein GY913_15930 [Proteobacteria bacterium]|nr:hypothetical protein [Pseudomonadota bacterium]MCP4918395.1 hypothetical protein [Pseudomonadota bacterium]
MIDVPDCVAYASDPASFAYCAYNGGGRERWLEGARLRSSHAGAWSEACRESWAASPTHCGNDVAGLLSLCETDECGFAVLDARGSADLLEQVDLCERHAGVYATDCAGHALQRWLIEGPEVAEVDALMARSGPDVSGYWAGLAMVKLGEGGCDGADTFQPPQVRACRQAQARCSQAPEWCEARF